MTVALTEGELLRLSEAMVAKALSLPRVVLIPEDEDEYIRTVVQTAVTDTYLVLNGALKVEDFEDA